MHLGSRRPRRRAALALAATVCIARAPQICPGQMPECRDGASAPHCPVRPAQFGYYQTQWRRWPDGTRPPERPGEAGTPAAPERSLEPGPDEESPPRPATPPAAALEPVGEPALARLVAEADAARLAGPEVHRSFTMRLIDAMLSEHDPQTRSVILGLAAGFATPAADAICIGALEDPDPRVRLTACRVCAERCGPDGVARLARRAHEDSDLGVRLRAVRTLGEVRDPAVIPHLVALLEDPDPAIQARASAALARATGRNFGSDVDRWKRWAASPQDLPPRWSPGAAIRALF